MVVLSLDATQTEKATIYAINNCKILFIYDLDVKQFCFKADVLNLKGQLLCIGNDLTLS